MPLQKGYGDFVCHGDKSSFLLVHLTTPPHKCGTYPQIIDSTVNESTSDSMARTGVTAGAYNRNIDKR